MRCAMNIFDIKMRKTIFILVIIVPVSESVIYKLNDTEYLRMPPVYYLDDYDSCIHQINGTYCYVEMELVSDTPSELLLMIHEYSEHTCSHFNHTRLHHGICLTKTCKRFFQQSEVINPKIVLEKCLNESLWRDYKLKTKLANTVFCNKLDEPIFTNIGDISVAVAFVGLGLLNIIGSLYDHWFNNEDKGNKILLSFSLQRNFQKLIAHKNKNLHQERLKGLHGLRLLSIMLVIFGHAPLPFVNSTENPHELEKSYYDIVFHIFYNGTLIVQTFFVMTGLLLAYNIRIFSEKNELNWVLIPKGIMMRWLRLTPAYAMVLIFTLTWFRFIANGPLWEVAIGVEVVDCHRFGWLNVIYLNNYIDSSQCMPHTWYLAADFQLYILGLFVCVMARTSKSRNVMCLTLFFIGFMIPAIHTYVQDLDAVVIVAPETARKFFFKDPTFDQSYKRGHTNIPGIMIGLALGNVIYDGLRDEKIVNKYKKLGVLYYLVVPTGFGVVLSGIVFYQDRPRLSIYLRTAVAALIRPLFAMLVTLLIIGMVFKFENLYRRILEWHGWRIPARVSYSAYLIHVTIIRIFAGMNTTLLRSGMAQYIKEALGIILITFFIAYPFWLFVETPLNEIIKLIFGLSEKDKKDIENCIIDNIGQSAQGTAINTVDSAESETNT